MDKFIPLKISMVLITLLSLAATCIKSHSNNLTKIGQYDLTMPEPSGLALDPDGQHLWIVSDNKGQVYKTNLVGQVVDKVDIKSSDFEGVAISSDGQTLFLLDESKNEIVFYNLEGDKLEHIDIDTDVSKKSGPEGLDIDQRTGNFIVVNEKNPRLFIELTKSGEIIRQQEVTPLSDLSAVAINSQNKEVWLLSDQDQKLIRINSEYQVVDEYLIDIEQMEGLAIDFKSKRIYIVSDAEEELHIFDYK